jgi:hypothetical protein
MRSVMNVEWGLRAARLCGACLVLALLARGGSEPDIRTFTVFFMASIAGVAIVYELSPFLSLEKLMVLLVVLIAAFTAITYATLNYFYPYLANSHAALIAAGDDLASSGCDDSHTASPKSDLIMTFGPDRVIGLGNGPFTPIRVGTCTAITLERKYAGLVINAFGFDSGDNVAYQIENNRFEQFIRGSTARVSRPDRSTLVIYGDRGAEILRIYYSNPNAVKISGTFRCGGTRPVIVSDRTIRIGGVSRSNPRCVFMGEKRSPAIAYFSDR